MAVPVVARCYAVSTSPTICIPGSTMSLETSLGCLYSPGHCERFRTRWNGLLSTRSCYGKTGTLTRDETSSLLDNGLHCFRSSASGTLSDRETLYRWAVACCGCFACPRNGAPIRHLVFDGREGVVCTSTVLRKPARVIDVVMIYLVRMCVHVSVCRLIVRCCSVAGRNVQQALNVTGPLRF